MKNDLVQLQLLLPEPINGWRITEKDQMYNPKNLFDYIDGGAELYLSYGFQQVVTRTFTKTDEPDIIVDIFDMGSSESAFGVFSHSREVIDTTFGQGSQYTAGLLLFWKDRYYVSLMASYETEQARQTIFQMAHQIDAAIPQKGQMPKILSYLPQKNLVRESIRFFRHHVWLNSHYFISDENILHINQNTAAVLAKYHCADQKCILLLIQYPTLNDAERAYRDFIRMYLPELQHSPSVQIEDGTWTACQLNDRHLIIVFNAPDEKMALDLIFKTKNNLQ